MMELNKQIKAFISTYQTTGYLLAGLIGGLLVQLLLFVILSIFAKDQAPALYETIIGKMVLPADIRELIFQPWSLVTYPFFVYQFDLLRILITGLILWTFGRIHQQLMGDLRTRRLLILGLPLIGLLAVVLSTIIGFGGDNPAETMQDSPISPNVFLFAYGLAPAMVMLTASAITLVPNFSIQLFLFGRVRIVWVGVVLILIELLVASFTPQGVLVLLGGLVGVGHILLLRNGTDITEEIWSFYTEDKTPTKMKVKYGKRTAHTGSRRGGQRKANDPIPQEMIDRILDKISEKGYESLSREEKEMLFKASSQSEDNAKE